MHITRKALIKWSIIVVVCGVHSLFWGMNTTHALLPMLLGMLTLILMFSLVESHPKYQARRAIKHIMARALDVGVKIRLLWALYVPIGYIGMGKSILLAGPYTAELYIGLVATAVCKSVLGIDVVVKPEATSVALMQFEKFISVYFTTMLTGLIHTVILALLCLLVWGAMKLRVLLRAKKA